MAMGPRDREPVGDDLEVIDLVTDEPASTARSLKPGAGNEDRPPRRRLLVLAIGAAVVTIAGVSVWVVSRDDGDAEAGPSNRGTSNASSTVPAVVPGSTVIPPEERPPVTSPGDASTTAPLLAEGAPSSPHVGNLVASVTDLAANNYYLYADGRLIWSSDPTRGFVEQRLTPQGVERVQSEFLVTGLFDPDTPNPSVPNVQGFGAEARVRDDVGRLLTGRVSPTDALHLVSYFKTRDATLPETEWAATRIRTYVPSRIQVCLQTFVNVPDRVVPVPLDLSIVVPAFPARAADLLGGREPMTGPDPACFEVTLGEARILADEFLTSAGGGSHQYSGIVVRNPRFDAIQPDTHEGIVAYIRFNTLLPDGVQAGPTGP